MKTVTAVFKDGGFKPSEFERLQKLIIQTLREQLPEVIIRVERNSVAWDSVVTRVSGYWQEDSEPILRRSHPIILEIWKKGEWRDGFKPATRLVDVFVPIPPVEQVEVPVQVETEVEKIQTFEQGEING